VEGTKNSVTVKPRVIVVFNKRSDYDEMKAYAESKGFLDMKNFFMFAAKSYMTKYRPNTSRSQEDV
jgi:hypothetical protein